ncbi:MAG: RNB domain-containing ribonuclease [Micavibrio sp.]
MSQKRHGECALDFNAGSLLQRNLDSNTRPHIWGITIDPANARVLDDGIFITKIPDGWTVDVSIADVPAMIPDKSEVEHAARKIQYERKGPNGMERVFPYGFLLNYVSLQQGAERPAITFSITLDDDLNIVKYDINRTLFLNKKQCNDNDIQDELKRGNEDVRRWTDLAKNLHKKRQQGVAANCDAMVAGDGVKFSDWPTPSVLTGNEGHELVHEAMRLANEVATDFLTKSQLDGPFKPARGEVDVVRVTKNHDFDKACNTLAWQVVGDMCRKTAPLVHVTSPMREYKHYLGLKIIGRELDGLESDPSLKRQALQITEQFNAKAAEIRPAILSDQWQGRWVDQFHNQSRQNYDVERTPGSQTKKLKELCKDRGWDRPLFAERRLLMDGTDVMLAALNFSGPAGDCRVWAVSANAEQALEMASYRLLKILAKDYPEKTKGLDVPKPKGP